MNEIERLDTIERRREFFRMYPLFVMWFGKASVDRELAKLPFDSIVEKYVRRAKSQDLYQKPNYFLGKGFDYITEHHPFDSSYSRTVRVECDRFLVPHTYQGLTHEKIIRPCLAEKYGWLRKYQLAIYEVHNYSNGVDEFYVSAGKNVEGHQSLYVPYNAFFAGDADAIIKRNKEYLEWYAGLGAKDGKVKDIWGTLKDAPMVQRFLESVAKRNKPK